MEPNAPENGQGKPTDPYEFITESGNDRKLPKLSIGGLSGKAKLVMLVAGGIFLLIIISVVYGTFFRTPENSALLQQVGRQQSEILQASEIGVDKARSQAARNLAITTKLSLIDDQKSLLAALGGKNVKVSTSDDPELEQMLVVAEQANRFDEELLEYLHTELTSYADNLQAAYNTTIREDKELRDVLAAQYKNARYLAGEGAGDTSGQQ